MAASSSRLERADLSSSSRSCWSQATSCQYKVALLTEVNQPGNSEHKLSISLRRIFFLKFPSIHSPFNHWIIYLIIYYVEMFPLVTQQQGKVWSQDWPGKLCIADRCWCCWSCWSCHSWDSPQREQQCPESRHSQAAAVGRLRCCLRRKRSANSEVKKPSEKWGSRFVAKHSEVLIDIKSWQNFFARNTLDPVIN